jgi:hypothetical protein
MLIYRQSSVHRANSLCEEMAGSTTAKGAIALVSNDLTLEISCIDFLVYASAGMITV